MALEDGGEERVLGLLVCVSRHVGKGKTWVVLMKQNNQMKHKIRQKLNTNLQKNKKTQSLLIRG